MIKAGLKLDLAVRDTMPTTISRKRKNTHSLKMRSRPVLKKLIEASLREKFPQDTVEVSDGFEGNIHVLVVSRVFDKMAERAKFSYLWRIIESTDLTDAEKDLVTALIAYSPRELM
jgi:hypothetical protein